MSFFRRPEPPGVRSSPAESRGRVTSPSTTPRPREPSRWRQARSIPPGPSPTPAPLPARQRSVPTSAATSPNVTQNSASSTLILSGANIAYTGATVVNAGTLSVTGSASTPLATNAITVAGGATLNLVNGATQNLGSLTGLNLGAGTGTATLGLELGDMSNYDRLGTSAVASVASTIRFNITALSGFGIGDYTLLSGAIGSAFNSAATYAYGGLGRRLYLWPHPLRHVGDPERHRRRFNFPSFTGSAALTPNGTASAPGLPATGPLTSQGPQTHMRSRTPAPMSYSTRTTRPLPARSPRRWRRLFRSRA